MIKVPRISCLLVLAASAWACDRAAWSQSNDTNAVPPARRAEGGLIEEAQPSIFYLDDGQGGKQMILNFTVEDFERLWWQKVDESGVTHLPPYRLEEIVAQATIDPHQPFAEVSLRLSVVVSDKNWARLPLRLDGCVLRDRASYEGPGEHLLEAPNGADEYVAYFRGASPRPHVLTLKLLAPITTHAGRSRLDFPTPRAARSELSIRVPTARAIAEVSPGALLEAPLHTTGFTDFKVLGLSSDFWIAWHSADEPLAGVPTVLECEGLISATLDGRGVSSDAALTVKSYGAEFDVLRFQLPPGSVLVSGDQPGYTVRAVREDEDTAKNSVAVEARLVSKTVGPVTVRLATQQANTDMAREPRAVLTGFELQGAVRQWGHLAVRVTGDWRTTLGTPRRARQVEVLPNELWSADNVAGFEYYGQPFSVEASLAPRETRLHVSPEYAVNVGATQVELDARLRYQVAGAKVFSFEIDPQGWDLVEVGPSSVVSLESFDPAESGPWTIPLRQPLVGTVEISLRVRRAVGSEDSQVDLSLPKPTANSPPVGTLVVQTDDNIELMPEVEKLVGLSPQVALPAGDWPEREQPVRAYRVEAADTRFVAEMRRVRRIVQVEVDSTVDVVAERVGVRQRLVYHIGREALDRLVLDVPKELLASGELSIRQGDAALVLTTPTHSPDDAPTERVHAVLPKPALGDLEVRVEFARSVDPPIPEASVVRHVPLVMPADGDLLRNELWLRSSPRLKLYPPQSHWTTSQVAPAEGGMRLSCGARQGDVAFGLRLSDSSSSDTVRIERMWLQSLLWRDDRQDRAVYRVTTAASQVRIRPPRGAINVLTLVDDVVVSSTRDATGGEIVVPLSTPTDGPRTFVIDLRYTIPLPAEWESPHNLDPPRVVGQQRNAWCYWQVALPRDLLLTTYGTDYTHEYRWRYEDFHWLRRPLLDQVQLEAWVGVTHDREATSTANTYLFSGFGPPTRLPLRMARWSAMVLIGSGAVLLMGMLWLYVPMMRRSATVMLAGVALASVALMYPEQAVLLAQAAVFGALLVVVAVWLDRMAGRRAQKAVVVRGRASRAGELSSRRHIPIESPPPSTMSVPAVASSEPRP